MVLADALVRAALLGGDHVAHHIGGIAEGCDLLLHGRAVLAVGPLAHHGGLLLVLTVVGAEPPEAQPREERLAAGLAGGTSALEGLATRLTAGTALFSGAAKAKAAVQHGDQDCQEDDADNSLHGMREASKVRGRRRRL